MVPQNRVPLPSTGGSAVTVIWCWRAAGQLVTDARLKGNAEAGSAVLGRCGSVGALLPQDPDLPKTDPDLLPLLNRIADALERLAPPAAPPNELEASDAFVWHADRGWLEPVHQVNRVEIGLLRGIDRVRDILLDNTERFAAGPPGQQRIAVGRPRHRQEFARQSGARRRQRKASARPRARRDPPGRYSEPAPSVVAVAAERAPLPVVLRRPVLRSARHELQIAEGGPRRAASRGGRQMSCSTRHRTAAI